ncbi:hypothetical protein GCM10022214_09500 [Actinomadura miaoliensis]|uniref:Uncharacterized protein n=1 Tax=Actinomadura miaoliensis TaxID=430685 RepID=A0ABP7V423_9ACTN
MPRCRPRDRAAADAVRFRSGDAAGDARDADLAVVLEGAHAREGVGPDPLPGRCPAGLSTRANSAVARVVSERNSRERSRASGAGQPISSASATMMPAGPRR